MCASRAARRRLWSKPKFFRCCRRPPFSPGEPQSQRSGFEHVCAVLQDVLFVFQPRLPQPHGLTDTGSVRLSGAHSPHGRMEDNYNPSVPICSREFILKKPDSQFTFNIGSLMIELANGFHHQLGVFFIILMPELRRPLNQMNRKSSCCHHPSAVLGDTDAIFVLMFLEGSVSSATRHHQTGLCRSFD